MVGMLRTAVLGLCIEAIAFLPVVANDGAQPIERESYLYFFSDSRYVEIADKSLNRARDRLIQLTGDTLTYRPAIYIVDNSQRFNELIGGKFPDWGAAAAFAERRLIAIKSPDHFNINRSLEELLAHEYTHLLLAQSSGLGSLPRWFDEGLAMHVSMEWSWSDNLAMGKAAVFGQLIDLEEIRNVNRFNESKAHLAYAESYLAVNHLIVTYGPGSIKAFIAAIASGGSEADAIYEATGLTTDEFGEDYRLYLNRRFNVASLFMDTIFFWLGLSVLVIIGAALKYRRKKRYYRRWERQEQLESTDFEYGDPDNPEQIDDEDEPWRT